MRLVLIFALLAPLATFAQDGSGLAAKIEAVKFPVLAKHARHQGDVRLRSDEDGVKVISGEPLLTQVAVDSLKAIGKISDTEVEATYHFVLMENKETRVSKSIEQRGNRFTRVFLRVFRRNTERVVEYQECVENPVVLKNKVDLRENRLEVWIYAWTPCIDIEAARIAQ